MQTQDKTVKVRNKKNGIEREFSQTQIGLMGKKNRKMFQVLAPEETELEEKAQETEVQRLTRENSELRALAAKAQNPAPAPAPDPEAIEAQRQAEALRDENNKLKETVTSELSSLESTTVDDGTAADDADPNPELSALRAKYEEVVGKKPGRLGIDKMQEAIDAVAK